MKTKAENKAKKNAWRFAMQRIAHDKSIIQKSIARHYGTNNPLASWGRKMAMARQILSESMPEIMKTENARRYLFNSIARNRGAIQD